MFADITSDPDTFPPNCKQTTHSNCKQTTHSDPATRLFLATGPFATSAVKELFLQGRGLFAAPGLQLDVDIH